MTKKRLIVGFLGFSIFALPLIAGAATFMADDSVTSTETVNDNLYVAGGNPVVSGDVNGDLFIAGGNVNVSGNVTGDVGAAGGTVAILGNVDGDVRVFGGSLYIDSEVGGEVISFGGQIIYGPHAKIGKDLIAGGDEIIIDPEAIVAGEKRIFEDTSEQKMEKIRDRGADFMRGAYWMALLYGLLAYLVVAAAIMGLFPKLIKKYGKDAMKDSMAFWKNLGVGLLVMIGLPIVAILLFITMVGAMLGGILLVLFVLYILINLVTAGFLFGALMQKWMKQGNEINWLWGLGGVVALSIISQIPLIGWLIGLTFFLWSVGTMASENFRLFRSVK